MMDKLAVATTALVLAAVLAWTAPIVRAEDDGVAWREYAAGLAESKARNKPAVIFWYLPYCGTCKAMKRKVMPDPRIIETLNRDLVPIRLDFDRNKELGASYQVDNIPTFLVLSPAGKVVARRSGYQGRDTFLRFLSCAARGETAAETCREVLFD